MTDEEFKKHVRAVASKYLAEAVEHERAAGEIELTCRLDEGERDMNEEAARVYRKCAAELLAAIEGLK